MLNKRITDDGMLEEEISLHLDYKTLAEARNYFTDLIKNYGPQYKIRVSEEEVWSNSRSEYVTSGQLYFLFSRPATEEEMELDKANKEKAKLREIERRKQEYLMLKKEFESPEVKHVVAGCSNETWSKDAVHMSWQTTNNRYKSVGLRLLLKVSREE